MCLYKQYGGLLNSNQFQSDFIKKYADFNGLGRPQQGQIIGEYFINNIHSYYDNRLEIFPKMRLFCAT